MIRLSLYDGNFRDWQELLALIQSAFSYMEGRIDPPSSLAKLTIGNIQTKAEQETLLLAWDHSALVGCVFIEDLGDWLYIGKLAIAPPYQGKGIGQSLIAACTDLARTRGKSGLELQTRIELVENHTFFSTMGFVKTGETAHQGYDRPTSITMRSWIDIPGSLPA